MKFLRISLCIFAVALISSVPASAQVYENASQFRQRARHYRRDGHRSDGRGTPWGHRHNHRRSRVHPDRYDQRPRRILSGGAASWNLHPHYFRARIQGFSQRWTDLECWSERAHRCSPRTGWHIDLSQRRGAESIASGNRDIPDCREHHAERTGEPGIERPQFYPVDCLDSRSQQPDWSG